MGKENIKPYDGYNETVKIWADDFLAGEDTIEQEIDDVKGTIDNEELWEKGSSSQSEAEMHAGNISDLKEYLAWLEENSLETYYITFRIDSKFVAAIKAKDLKTAMKRAESEFSDADFGAAEDIDGEIVSVEDEDDNTLYERNEDGEEYFYD